MLFTLPQPYGMNHFIQAQQQRLYRRLCQLWNVSDVSYNSFGLTNRNQSDDGYIPEWYDPIKQYYTDGTGRNIRGGMFYEDTLSVVSFYGLQDPVKRSAVDDDMMNVSLYFFVNLDKITPGGFTSQQGQRMDEEAMNDVMRSIQYNGNGFKITSHYRSIDKVLELYSGTQKRKSLQDNMQPKLCFRIDMSGPYNSSLYPPYENTYAEQPKPQMPKSIVLFIKNSPDLSKTIDLGNGRKIQQEYAPGNTLTPRLSGQPAYLIGRDVEYPFTYNNQPETVPSYANGVWDRSALGGFSDGDFVAITFNNSI